MQWWETDKYTVETPIPTEFEQYAGPKGIATVRTFSDGRTAPGWGLVPARDGTSFMDNYRANKFNTQIAKVGWLSNRWQFAFVMRSMALVCIDIDGKNGGFENVGGLGMLPPTLAETSKSGDGYHLFYSTPWDVWNDMAGFAWMKDRIGIKPGVDIRAVGCVYHYWPQRWNTRPVEVLTPYLRSTWEQQKKNAVTDVQDILDLLDSGSEDEVLVFRASLMEDLKKDIPEGKRNTTLYAIGVQMLSAGITGWETLITNRGLDLGLDQDEMDKLITNVRRYR